MNLSDGFGFISKHRPWCCIVRGEYWKELLKQAVLEKLEEVGNSGELSISNIDIKRKQLKRRAIGVYSEHHPTLVALQSRLDKFKKTISTTYSEGS